MRSRDVSEPIELDLKDLDVWRMIKALERGEFMLYYQPQVSVETAEVAGAEALIRWQHPSRGLLAAASFLPALQDLRFALRVGEWACWRARQDIESWRRAGLKTVPIAVNIHPEHLSLPQFAPMFLSLSKGMIDIEIVELPGREEQIVPALETLRAAGVRVALDDFGIGYSSFGRLAELPVDILKVDKSFICALTRPSSLPLRVRTRRILATLVSLAHICNFTTIVEGVETPAALEAARELGFDQSQGYLHSPAVSADAFRRFLRPSLAGRGAAGRAAPCAAQVERSGAADKPPPVYP